jgi:hypothetical protein
MLIVAPLVLTNVFFSLGFATILWRFNRSSDLSPAEIILYSAGTGPILASLLLYYSLLLVPHQPDAVYLAMVILSVSVLAIIGRGSLASMAAVFSQWRRSGWQSFKSAPANRKTGIVLFWLLLIFLLSGYLWMYGNHTLHTPLEGHDVLQYAVMGKVFHQEKAIEFHGYRPYEKTGFYSRNSHAPSFSLLATWERLLNGVWGVNQDLYFKSTGAFYGLCIVLVFLFHLARRSRWLALLGLLTLFSGLGFFLTLVTFHLDSFRMFFLLVSWILLAKSVMKRSRYLVVVMAVFSGFAAFAHSLGAIVAGLNVLALMIFHEGDWKEKLGLGSLAAAIILACGGIHYVIDTFWGTGWILLKG